jgi:phosphinothricin acetyltransferase
MLVRAVVLTDFPAVAAITNHYIATTAIHFGDAPLSAASFEDAWRAEGGRYPWFVAAEGDEVVGYAKAARWRERAAYDWTAEVGVYVSDRARGRGAGRALYAALLDELASRGFRSVIGGITLPNDASVALHRAFGFVSVGTVREAGWKFESWHDVEFWQKQLDVGDAPPRPLTT